MKTLRITESLIVISILISFSILPAIYAAPGVSNKEVNQLLAQVRQATVKYQDVSTAEADGYVSTEECVQEPGLGGMGVHYVNFMLTGDLAANPLMPEALLYLPTENGFRLIGVEYFVVSLANTPEGPSPWFETDPMNVPPLGWFNPAPTVFGQTMNGPMPGHEPGMPWHYDFHVWLWQANPDGIFEEYNPNIRCEV